MTDDIVERLRNNPMRNLIFREAAAEIEQLRSDKERMRFEIAQLQAALHRADRRES